MSPNKSTQGHLMKIKWLVANVSAVGSPDSAERAILEVILGGHFFANSGRICGLMKMEWLVTDVTAVGSPDRAEHAILGVILAGRCFAQFGPFL